MATDRDYSWEQYVTDPGTEPNPDNWVTHIFIPLD